MLFRSAIDRMNARGLHQLPVIDKSQPGLVIGILQQEHIALACSVATTRQALSKYEIVAVDSIDIDQLPQLKSQITWHA